MSDQDIRDQLEGLFSDIVPESDVAKEDASPPAEASPGPAGAEVAQAEPAPAPKTTGSSEEKWSSKPYSPPVSEPQWHVLASIRARLIFFLVLAATLPLIVAGVWSFYTLQSTIQAASDRSEAALVELGEAAIAQTARATARQLELYLDTHPDVDLNDLTQLESNTELAELAVQPVGKTGYTAVFDENAITHFHANPGTVGMDMSTLADTLPQFWAIFAASLDGSPSDGYYDWEDADGQVRAKYMSIVPVGNTRLRVAATTYIDEFSEPVAAIRSQLAGIQRTALIQLLLALVGVFLIATTGTLLIGRWVSRPISRMAAMVAYIEKGERRLTGLEGRRDEFGVLARAFNRMATQVQQTVDDLERRVAERTRVLELAAQVGSRLSIVHGLDGLLAEAARLIQENFGLYHTLIYLADPAGRSLMLRAGSGEAGAELLRRGHSLSIGPGSISGAAAAQKQAVLVSDTAHSPAFRPNPLLPDTRSETAVPLLIGERLVGVLDLQSAQPGALTPEKLIAFEALAGQLAVAVDNARLFGEAARARAEVEAQAQRQTRRGWEEFLDGIERSERIDYAYERGNLEPVVEPRDETPEVHALTVPIQIQGASMGAIQIEGDAGRIWTQSDAELVETIVRQVAQQADNLRLLAQAEGYRAQAEGASRRLTREGWAAFLETQAIPVAGFAYDLFQVKPVTNGSDAGEPALSRPLEVRGETIGHLAVEEAGELDEEATQLLTTVAERLSDHIENLRLLEEAQTRRYELEERSRELEASQRVTFAASETSDPDELLDLVVNLIRDQFDLYHAQMYLVDKDRQAAVLRKSTGYAGRQLLEAGHSIPLEESSLVTRAIRQGEPLVVNDVSEDEDWMPNPLLPHTRSELVVPLRVGGSVIGALDVQSRTPGSFTPGTVALFQTMAEQVAMNFATTDLLARTTEQAEALTRFATQLRTAADVTERLSAILDPDQLLSEVVEMLHSRFGLYHAHVYLMETPPTGEEATGAQLVVRAGSGEVGKILCERGHRISLDAAKSLVARAARDRETVYVEDTTTKSDFMPNPLLPQTRSEVAMPLIAGDQVLGVLDVQDDQPGRFTEADLDTFTTLAGQVATALENARLFTEQQQTQQALRESEAQQRLVFESSPTPTLVTQVDGTILYANPQVSRLFGKPLEELISHGAPGLYYDPSERQAFLDAMERDGRVRNYDIRFKKADGTIIWGLLSSEPITFDGKPAFVNGVYDVTELKEAQEAIRESQQRFQGLVENLNDWIWEVDPNGAYTYVSPKVTDLLGYQPEEMLGKTPFDFMPADEVERVAAIFGEIVAGQKPIEALENTNIHKDGHLVVFETSGTPIFDAQGKFQGYRGTDRDITERKQAEAAVHESQQMLQLVMNNIPHSIFWKNRDLVYLGCNQNFADDAGKESPEEVIGKTDYHMPWLDQAEAYRADDSRVMEADEPVLNYEEPQTTPDGGQIWLRTSKVPLHDANGNVMAVLGLYEDVTSEKQAEQILRESEERFRGLYESSPLGIILNDFEGGDYLEANDAFLEMMGYTLEELNQLSYFDVTPQRYEPDEAEQIRSMEETGRYGPYEKEYIRRDGTAFPVVLNGVLVTDSRGRKLIWSTVEDITERKRAEEAVLQEKNFSDTVINSLPGLFYLYDEQGRLVRWNRNFEEVSGYSAQELSQRYVLDFIAEGDRQLIASRMQEVFTGGQSSAEAHLLTKSDEKIPYYFTGLRAIVGDKVYLAGVGVDITERVRAEEALLESQQMLQLIMNNIPQSIFWKDKDLVFMGCNRNFAKDAGLDSADEVIGKTDYDMPWLDQAELYRADDRRVMEAGEPVLNYEEPQTTPDGSQIWLRTSKVPLYDANGDVLAVLGLYADVTAEKQAEQILRESEERFRGLYESSPLGIILNDYERGDYLEANDAFLEMMGYTLEELNQLSYFDVTPKKYEADEAEQIRSMEETGRYGPYEKEYIRKDGSIFPVLLNGVLVTDSRGRKLIWSTVADITERVRAEQERERFTNQLRTAADLTEQVNAILDPDQLLGEVVTQLHDRFNLYHVHVYLLDGEASDPAAGRALVMRAGSGEIGQVMLEREHKIPLDREQSLVARAARTGEIVHAADTALDADFMPNPLLPETRSEVAVPLMAGDRVLGILDVQDNQPGRFTQSDLDIFSTLAGQISTALQNAGLFEEVQQTAERLREVDRLKSEFLANMSHELRTPLNSILGYTEVMLMGLNGDLDPDTQEDVQAIYDNGQHLLRLINDVLDLAKIEAGRMALNIEDVEIAPLLEDIKTNSAGLLVNKPVEMILEIDEELPSIKADRTRVNQVLTNLVSNAAKFTEQGQVTLRAFCEDDEWICLEVQDTGIGIQEADLESIFEQFRQADGSFKRRAEGTGLGLAITRHLVTMHGGTISVHSQVGSGSTFTVRLPIRSRVVEAISGSSDGQQV